MACKATAANNTSEIIQRALMLGAGFRRSRTTHNARLSFSRILPRIGQGNEIAPGKNLFEFLQQRIVDKPIRCERLSAVQLKRAAVKIRHSAARFLHHQHASSRVPGIEIEFPKTIEAAAGDGTQIQRSRSRTPHPVRTQGDLVVKVDIRILMSLMAWKASGDKGFGQRGSF